MTQISKIDMNCYHIDTPLRSDDGPDCDGERTVEQLIYRDINPDSIVLKGTAHYVESGSRHSLAREIVEMLRTRCSSESERKRFNCVIDYYCRSKPDGSRFTLDDIGKKYGVSRERIRQMIRKEMAIMRMRLFSQTFTFSDDVNRWWMNRKKGMFDYKKIIKEFRD